MLVHVSGRIRVHLCDGGERERITPCTRVTHALHPRDPSFSRPHAIALSLRSVALAAMIREGIILQPSRAEAFGHAAARSAASESAKSVGCAGLRSNCASKKTLWRVPSES